MHQRLQRLICWNFKMANNCKIIEGQNISYNKQESIPDLFKHIVDSYEDIPALSFGGTTLSYKQLSQISSALAIKLIESGCMKGCRIALCFDKGVDFVISILAVLKAGCVYVPIDPDYPFDRIQSMLQLSDTSLTLVDSNGLALAQQSATEPQKIFENCIVVDLWREKIDLKNITLDNQIFPYVKGDDPAYIIFTSGTTGLPKGVINAHNRVTNLVLHYQRLFEIGIHDCVSQIPSFSFDASVGEIFSALLTGAHLKIFPTLKLTDPKTLTQLLCDYAISFATFSPTALSLVKPYITIENSLNHLKTVIVGGEPFPTELARYYVNVLPHVIFHNIYGPTETTVFCTSIKITPVFLDSYQGAILPIGYPIANTCARVIDQGDSFGEIEIGGDCVSLGYFQDITKTEEKYTHIDGETYYSTGDIGCLTDEGYLIIAGRTDDQVKINGMRVELGEISAKLEAQDDVIEATTIFDKKNNKIISYCTISNAILFSEADLKTSLAKELPHYMIPARIVSVDEMPMTTSGKVDKKRLPKIDWSILDDREIVPPETDEEALLAKLFAEVLQVDSVSREDDFYSLGGDSVSALRMASLLRNKGFELAQKELIRTPRLDVLATKLRPLKNTTLKNIVPAGQFKLSPIQHWFNSLKFDKPSFYHQSMELRIEHDLNIKQFQVAFDAVIEHHDQLRAHFISSQNDKQIIADKSDTRVKLAYYDYSNYKENKSSARHILGVKLRESVDFFNPPLICGAIIKMDKSVYEIVLVIHHALVDTVSWHIIGSDLITAYKQLQDKASINLSPKSSSYYQWCESISASSNKDEFIASYLPLWEKEINLKSNSVIRTAGNRAKCKTETLSSAKLVLDTHKTELLINDCNTAYSTKTEELILATIYHSLAIWMDRGEVCIDLEWHGRNTFSDQSIEISNTVGWFTAIYPMLVNIEKGQSIKKTLINVKDTKRSKKCNGASFGVLRYLSENCNVKSRFKNYSSPDIIFNYSGIIESSTRDWKVLPISAIESAPNNITPYCMAVESSISNGQLTFDIYYHEHHCQTQAIEQFLELVRNSIEDTIRICQSKKNQQKTPSDFPMVSLTSDEASNLPITTQAVLPLSDIQLGILVQSLSSPNSQMYHVQVLYEFERSLDKKCLNEAFNVLVNRHASLRTYFLCDGEKPLQLVDSKIEIIPKYIDFSCYNNNERDEYINNFICDDGKILCDIEKAPLLRVHVFELKATNRFRVLLNVHHLILDGWSLAILIDELSMIYDYLQYNSKNSGNYSQLNLLDVTADYSDYIGAQLTYINNASARKFWMSQAKKCVEFEHADFPVDYYGDEEASIEPESIKNEILCDSVSNDLYQKLRLTAQKNEISLNSILFAGFILFISTVKQTNKISTGVITSGRSDQIPNSESIVGCCLNTLPAAIELDSDMPVSVLLNQVHQQLVEVIEHCLFPLSEVLSMARSISDSGEISELFDCTYDFESYRYVADGEADRPTMIGGYEMTNYNMEINLIEEQGKLSYRFTYNPLKYSESTLRRWSNHFKAILKNLAEYDNQKPVCEVSEISPSERERLNTFSGFTADFPDKKSVYHFVEEFADINGDRIAFSDHQTKVSYKQLNDRANRIANYLIRLGVQPDSPVAVIMERSIDFAATVIAIWKSGAAYMPIDPDYPQDRINTLLNNALAKIAVTKRSVIERIVDINGACKYLCIDDEKTLQSFSKANLNLPFNPDNLAYVLFTSGSTGMPKGVMIEHKGMMNNIQSEVNDFSLDSNSVIAQTASQCFDVSVWQFFAGLTVGAKICIYSKNVQLDPELFIEKALLSDGVTNLQLVPSYVNELINYLEEKNINLEKLRMLSITGEALKLPLLERWLSLYPNISVINAYGPAEASDDITHHILTDIPDDGVIPIGKPTQNARIYILDSQLKQCPIGVIGEICVAGVCVGRGYINDVERTKESFGADPIRNDGSRFYRTGDLGRWRDDGVLEFHGRKDYQVKINGFRVELGEIENQLSGHPVLTDVAVVINKRNNSDKGTLTAFVCSSEDVAQAELRTYIAGRVPSHMVPARFIVLDKMPTNTSGKVDKKYLQTYLIEQTTKSCSRQKLNDSEVLLKNAVTDIFCSEGFSMSDSFFNVGGDSLKAVQLVSRVRKLGGELDVQSVFMHPVFKDMALLVKIDDSSATSISNRKPDCNQKSLSLDAMSLVPKSDLDLIFNEFLAADEMDNIESVYPLSSLQEGMLFHHMLDEWAYFGRYYLDVHGSLDVSVLEMSLNEILDRHEALRTGFIYEKVSRPFQIVFKKRHARIETHDFSLLDDITLNSRLTSLYDRESLNPFNLRSDVLMRLNVIKLGPNNYQIYITSHHIVMDGWSVANLLKELLNNYGFHVGARTKADTKCTQFSNYIIWLSQQDRSRAEINFHQYLNGYEPVSLKLPHQLVDAHAYGKEINDTATGVGKYVVKFESKLSNNLSALAKGLNVTVNCIIRVLWGLALQRYTYSKDVVFGCVISGRFPEIDHVNDIVGSLINTLPVRIHCTGKECLEDLIQRSQYDFVRMESNGHISLANIQKASNISDPLFDHILVSDNFPIDINVLNSEAKELGFSFRDIYGGALTNYDLTVLINTDKEATLTFEYNSRKFTEGQLSCVGGHLIELAEQLCANPKLRVEDAHILTAYEYKNIIEVMGEGAKNVIQSTGLIEKIHSVMNKFSTKTAVIFRGRRMSFSDIDADATRIANYLIRKGVGKNTIVPLIAERSFEMISAILGIIKAGGAYLPIDPTLPSERIHFILRDADPKAVLVWDESWVNKNTYISDIPITPIMRLLEDQSDGIGFSSDIKIGSQRDANSLAYVIYTSGSTGEPKGVQIEDSALLNRLNWMANDFDINSVDVILQKTVFTFDVSVWELILPFVTGATMSLLEQREERDPRKIIRQIEKDQVTVLHFVPSMLSAFILDLDSTSNLSLNTKSLRCCFTSGEALKVQHAKDFFNYFPDVKLYNLYGPTEAAVDVSKYTVKPEDETIPIGKPVDATQLYIFDVYNKAVPVGITGELHISGIQLARGYLNRPVLTCEKFSRGLFNDGRICYKTGDLSAWQTDGNIAYLGRTDHQVKIRGFRIELGEIESTICTYKSITESVIVTSENSSGNNQLIAFFAAREQISADEIRAFAMERLPKYMVPIDYIQLNSIPQTVNGKINRKQLLEIAKSQSKQQCIADPESEEQLLLLNVWKEVLDTEEIGIDHNFFESRGDSIIAIQIASRIQLHGYKLELEDLFNFPTVRELAVMLKPNGTVIDQTPFSGNIEATPIQNWFNENIFSNKNHWNQSLVLSAPDIDEDFVSLVFKQLCEHHDLLRSHIIFDSKRKLSLSVKEQGNFSPGSVERSFVSTEEELKTSIKSLQSKIDLENGPLIVMHIIRLHDIDRLVVIAHHLIIDGVSWRILIEDFCAAYKALKTKQIFKLPEKTHSFAMWSKALLKYATSRKLMDEKKYWAEIKSGNQNIFSFGVDGLGIAEKAQCVEESLNPEQTLRLLNESGRAYGIKPHELLLVALSRAIGQWKQIPSVCIDMESHGRTEIDSGLDITRTIGWFTSLYPVQLVSDFDIEISEHIKTVKEQLRKVPNSGIGYGVLRYFNMEFSKNLTNSQVLFNYLGQFSDNVADEFSISSEAAEFDIGDETELIYPLEIVSFVQSNILKVKAIYSGLVFNEEEIATFMQSYRIALVDIIDHCCAQEETHYTPSDFTDDEIDMDELSAILEALE